MEEIEKQIKNCKKCGDFPKPTCNSFKTGKSEILVVGESPARNGWLVSGKAFYDKDGKLQGTGKVLEKLLNICGLCIDDINFTECCKCQISDRSILEKCSENCKQYLLKQIAKSDCHIILAMGIFPSQVLLGRKIKKFKDEVLVKHKIIIGETERILIPIYHPSPVNPLGFKGNKELFEELKMILNNSNIE